MKNDATSGFLDDFIKNSSGNTKTAFIYKKACTYKKVSFEDFLQDIYRMNAYLEKNLSGNNILIFSYPYSYLFYVGIFSCVFLGKNIVIIDSFGDREKLRHMLNSAQVSDILTDNFTSKLGFLIPGKIHKIKMDFVEFCDAKLKQAGTKCNSNSLESASVGSEKNASIITFTSGTTGLPKMIQRNLDFLASQIELIKNNVAIFDEDLTYGLLPMYTLLSILMNHTVLVSKKINDCNKFRVSMILAPIKKVQKIKKPLPSVKRVFLGGAILYQRETDAILKKFPQADITYVYGASEGAIIYKTSLASYEKNPFTFDSRSKGIDVQILNPDKNGVGEIQISGKTVIGENHTHCTGDFGKIADGKLIIVGRKKYSCSEKGFYNYQADQTLRKNNPKIKNGFSFYYKNQIHLVYTGKITLFQKDVIYHRLRKLPYDLKHKTKLDYGKVILQLQL